MRFVWSCGAGHSCSATPDPSLRITSYSRGIAGCFVEGNIARLAVMLSRELTATQALRALHQLVISHQAGLSDVQHDLVRWI